MNYPPVSALNSLSSSADNILSLVNGIPEFRLPVYGAKHSRVWFAHEEALFIARGIRSQASKYTYVVGTLPIGIAAEVRDLIDQVPDSEPYYNLIQRTPVSDEKRLRQLLTSCELGDKRPSQLLKHMK